MAKGRMINNKITKNKKVHLLGDDTSRLAFTWLITFTDRDGRTYGDPAIVRSMLFPRRDDITLAQMTEYIQDWHDRKLIIWYEVDGDKYIYFPGFEDEQEGLRYDREAASVLPPPPDYDEIPAPELVGSSSGASPAEIKRKEVKRKEVNGIENTPPASASFSHFTLIDAERLYRNVTGQITIPPRSSNGDGSNDYLESLLTISAAYDDPVKMLDDGKRHFAKWTNTRGKNGAFYKKTNPGWVSWWLDELAPRPQAPAPIRFDVPAAICGIADGLKRQAEQDPEYYGEKLREHIRTCDFCSGKQVTKAEMPDDVKERMKEILGRKAIK